jgi:hypothetical protein
MEAHDMNMIPMRVRGANATVTLPMPVDLRLRLAIAPEALPIEKPEPAKEEASQSAQVNKFNRAQITRQHILDFLAANKGRWFTSRDLFENEELSAAIGVKYSTNRFASIMHELANAKLIRRKIQTKDEKGAYAKRAYWGAAK